VLTWVREGNVTELKNWLSQAEVKKNPEEEDNTAAQHRQDVFGMGTFAAGMSMLLWAVDGKNLEICEVLLQYYPSLLDLGDSEGLTPLHYASLNGDILVLTTLLEKGAIMKEDNYGDTPLHLAALNGHHEAARILLSKGANPNAQGQNGSTPLHNAVVNKQVKAIGVLLGHPTINTTIKDSKGRTAKMVAIEGGDKTVIDYFEKEKREKLEKISDLDSELKEYKENIANNEEKREADQRSITIAYKRLKDEEDAHKSTKEEILKLKEEVRTRTVSEHEERYQSLHAQCVKLRAQNEELHRKLEQLTEKHEMEQKVMDTQVKDAHKSLSNLIALFETTSMAIVSAKTEVESVRKFMKFPETENNYS